MTVSTTASRISYNGDGSSTAFAFPYYFLANTDLRVYVGGALKALTTDYTVTGAGTPSGGTVTFTSAPAIGSGNVVILRDPDQLQSTAYPANDKFPSAAHERALDKLTMLVQRIRDLLGRAMVLPDYLSGAINTTLPAPQANTVLGWNPDANALQNFDSNLFASVVAYGTAKADVFTGTGAQTNFTLSANPGAQNNLDVSIGGVQQVNGVDFTWTAGTTLTFTTAPPNGVKILARYMQGLPQGTIDPGSVQGLAGAAGSSYVGFQSLGTGAVLRLVQDKLREHLTPLDFGCVGDGVTDDTANFIKAITYAEAAKIDLYGAGKTYKITSALTFDLQYSGWNGEGATLNFASAPDGTICLTLRNTSDPYNTHPFAETNLVGASRTGTQTGILFQGATSGSAAHITLRNVVVDTFGTGAQTGNNSFLISWFGGSILHCNVCWKSTAGTSDFQENINFHGVTLYNSETLFNVAEVELYLYGCSLDYATQQFIVAANGVSFNMIGGHLEGNSDAAVWAQITGLDSYLNFIGAELYLTGTKTAFAFGSVSSSTSAINFDRVNFSGFATSNYGFNYLVAGSGNCTSIPFINGGSGTSSDNFGAVTHDSNNLLADGGFERTTITDFYAAQLGTIALSSAQHYAGTQSLSLAPAAGVQSIAAFQFACKPGDWPIAAFRILGSGFVGDIAYWQIAYFDKFGTQLSVGNTGSQSLTAANVPTSWTRYSVKPFIQAPAGTASVQFYIQKCGSGFTNSDGNGTLYLDDAYFQCFGSGGNVQNEMSFGSRTSTSASNIRVPSGFYLEGIRLTNTTANAVTGGLKFGTTSGGTDVAAAIAVGANADIFVPAASLSKSYFGKSSSASENANAIFYDAVTSWNSASVIVAFVMRRIA